MVFGFGRKKKKKGADDPLTDTGDNADTSGTMRRQEPQSGIVQPNRPGAMGVIRAAGTAAVVAGPDTADNKITTDEIPAILDASDTARRQRTVSSVGDLRNAAEPLIEELMQMGRDLEHDDLNVDSIDRHLAIIVVRGKKQVIDVIRRGVAELPDIKTVDDATRAESDMRQILKKVGDVLGRQTRVIHIFAKKHASRLKDNLEVMNEQHTKMRYILDKHNKADAESGEIRRALDALRRLHEQRAKKSQRVADLSDGIIKLQGRERAAAAEIKETKSSEEYKKYVTLLEAAKKCDAQMDSIRGEIRSAFERISRPLGRYEYGSSLDKDQQRILAGLVSDPASVMLPENAGVISDIISNVVRAVSSGSISVKDTEKTIALLGETADAVGPLTARASECATRKKDLAGAAQAVRPAKLDDSESLLSKSAAARKSDEERTESLRLEIKENDAAISDMLSDIQVRLCQHTGVRYAVFDNR